MSATAWLTAAGRIVGAHPERDRQLAEQDRVPTPQQRRTPSARAVDAQQVGDADAVPDDEQRSPSGRVHDPRGADRRGRGAQMQAADRRELPLERLHDRVGETARDEQRDEQPDRRVRDEVARAGARAAARIATGPAVKTSSDAPTTPRVTLAAFTKELSGETAKLLRQRQITHRCLGQNPRSGPMRRRPTLPCGSGTHRDRGGEAGGGGRGADPPPEQVAAVDERDRHARDLPTRSPGRVRARTRTARSAAGSGSAPAPRPPPASPPGSARASRRTRCATPSRSSSDDP